MSAGPQTEITIISLDIPACKSISVEVTDLQLRVFKVDGQNVYKPFFYSAKEANRKVELRVSGKFGVIDLKTNNNYQWIAMIVEGEIFSLPGLPKIPICNNEWFQCPLGQVCLNGVCIIPPNKLNQEGEISGISSAYTKTADGYMGECMFVIKTSRPFSYVSFTVEGEGAEIEKVSIKANNSLVLYSFPERNMANVFFNNSGFIEEEIRITIKATSGPSDISILFNGIVYAECGYEHTKPDSDMGAPAKNPPEGKGACPTTWGSIKKG